MTYEDLLIESDQNELVTKEKSLLAHKGRIKGNRIAIKRDMTTLEKTCTLAEELGHYYTSSGDILDQSGVINRKQELRARFWAYNKMIGLSGIIDAYRYGCACRSDVADFLDVTEEFLAEALECYRMKYGKFARIDNYVVFFDPCLTVFELI